MIHVVANKESNEEFVIPVTWSVFSRVKVQASSLKEAFEWAKEHADEIPLDTDSEYVDASYEISADSVEECEIYNQKKEEKYGYKGTCQSGQ